MRLPIFACLLLCLPPPLPAAEVPEAFRVFSEPVKASTLMRKEVRNAEGRSLGTVNEVVFDLENNRVHRVIVGDAGYSMHALKPARGESHLVLDVPETPVEQTRDGTRLMPASKLLGSEVVDVVIDAFWGNVAFAAVELGGALRPVPLDAFDVKSGKPVLRVERSRIQALEGFSRAQLDAHLGDRDFLQRHAHNAHQLTPLR